MKKIRVKLPFVFSHPDGKETRFAAGIHEVSDEIAAHDFIAIHKANGRAEVIEGDPESKPKRGKRQASGKGGEGDGAPAQDDEIRLFSEE